MVTQALTPLTGSRALARLEQATRMLAELRDIDDVKAIIDLAEAARVHAETARLGTEAINHATGPAAAHRPEVRQVLVRLLLSSYP
jgi:hypothetical protein